MPPYVDVGKTPIIGVSKRDARGLVVTLEETDPDGILLPDEYEKR
jgi:hypothetical protein